MRNLRTVLPDDPFGIRSRLNLYRAGALALVPAAGCDMQARIDEAERALLQDFPPVECRTEHTFTPGLYVRTTRMPAGTLVVSKMHKTTHPYTIHSGRCAVFIDGKGVEVLEGPHQGVTEAGTRRILYIYEDTAWSTYHVLQPGEEGDPEAIEDRIIERRELECGKRSYDLYLDKLRDFAHPALPVNISEGAP
jgi:hypothetical protein